MSNIENLIRGKTPAQIIADQRILDNIMVPVFFEGGSEEARYALQEILSTLLGTRCFW